MSKIVAGTGCMSQRVCVGNVLVRQHGVSEWASAKNGSDADSRCSVCLLEYTGSDSVRTLSPCKHVFHVGCIDSWFGTGKSCCPLCKADLPTTRRKRSMDHPLVAVVGEARSFMVLREAVFRSTPDLEHTQEVPRAFARPA